MLSVALQWRRACWLRHDPGKFGLVLLILSPLIFLAPLQQVFEGWDRAANGLFLLGVVAVTGYLGRESGMVQRQDIWPFQKSIPLADWHLSIWLINAAAIMVFLVWASLWYAAGQNVHSEWDIHRFGGVVAAAGLLFLLAHCFMFFIGATGIPRGIDLFTVSSVLGVFRDVLFARLPDPFKTVLHAVLPPVIDCFSAGALLVRGEASAIKPLLVVLIYSFVCCIGAILLLRRAKPPV